METEVKDPEVRNCDTCIKQDICVIYKKMFGALAYFTDEELLAANCKILEALDREILITIAKYCARYDGISETRYPLSEMVKGLDPDFNI